MESVINISIGVVSGVLTSMLLFALYKLKIAVFDPWLENRLYKGVILTGTWVGGPSNPEDLLIIKMDIKQSGYKISGSFSAETQAEQKYSNFYNIAGQIRDNFVILEYHPASRKRAGLGTFVLEVTKGGIKLEGNANFVSEAKMSISTFENIVLDRRVANET